MDKQEHAVGNEGEKDAVEDGHVKNDNEEGAALPNRDNTVDKEAFAEFATQAVAGPVMVLYRRPDIVQSMGSYKTTCEFFLARYLNGIWMSLLSQSDEYVTSSFEAMGHRSPVCLIHVIFAIGKSAFPDEPLAIGGAGNGSEEDRLDAVRNIVHHIIGGEINKLLEGGILNHECSGMSIEQERDRWNKEGQPNEEIFSFHRANDDDNNENQDKE